MWRLRSVYRAAVMDHDSRLRAHGALRVAGRRASRDNTLTETILTLNKA